MKISTQTLELLHITREDLVNAFAADHYIMENVQYKPHELLINEVLQHFGFASVEDYADKYARVHAVCTLDIALKYRGFCDVADFYIYKAKKHFPNHPTPPMPTSIPNNDTIHVELLKFFKGFHILQLMYIAW